MTRAEASARRKPIGALLWMISDLPHSIAKWKAKGQTDQATRAGQMLTAAEAELRRRGHVSTKPSKAVA